MVDYKQKYIKYKKKYLDLLKTNSKLIFIVGKAASGKTTVAKTFESNGYYLVSMDNVVKNQIIPKFKKEIDGEFNGEEWRIYRLYRSNDYGSTIDKARTMFVGIMKDIIKKHKRVVVEGSLSNTNMIKQIFGTSKDFTLYFVQPKDEQTYVMRLKQRFMEDPDNYGRLGFLKWSDKDGSALADYKQNGIDGKIIKEFIEVIGKEEYLRVQEWYDAYKDHFDVHIIIN